MTIEQFTAAVPAYLRFFQEYMVAEHPGEELTPDMILEFRQSLYGMAKNSITQYMKQLRAAFKFMLDMGLLSGENPVRTLLVGQERYQPSRPPSAMPPWWPRTPLPSAMPTQL